MTVSIQYKIRRFSPDDLQSVVKINKSCLPENYPDSFFLLIYSSFPEGFLVAQDVNHRSEIVAYTMNRIEIGISNHSRNPLKRLRKGHVISIAVMNHARKNRIANRMMLVALEEMVKKGAKECFLEVRESNAPAIGLYEQMGFEKIRLLKKYYSDNESAWLMSKKMAE